MSVIVEFSIFPLGKGESVSPYVARAVDVIRQSGLPCELGGMGTTIEGEWDEVVAVVTACVRELEADCPRLVVNLKADVRKGASGRIQAKKASVEAKIGAGSE